MSCCSESNRNALSYPVLPAVSSLSAVLQSQPSTLWVTWSLFARLLCNLAPNSSSPVQLPAWDWQKYAIFCGVQPMDREEIVIYGPLPCLSTCLCRCVSAQQALCQALMLPNNLQGEKNPLKILVTLSFERETQCVHLAALSRIASEYIISGNCSKNPVACWSLPQTAILALMTAWILVYSSCKSVYATTTQVFALWEGGIHCLCCSERSTVVCWAV